MTELSKYNLTMKKASCLLLARKGQKSIMTRSKTIIEKKRHILKGITDTSD